MSTSCSSIFYIATCKMMKNKRQPSKTFENCIHTYVYMHMQACTNTR